MRFAPKRFTILVPEAVWELASIIMASRGADGFGMLNVKLARDIDSSIWYGCEGQIDDADTYEKFCDPWSLHEYLQTFQDSPLEYEPEDIVDVFSAAVIIEHSTLVGDEFWATIGCSIVGVVVEA